MLDPLNPLHQTLLDILLLTALVDIQNSSLGLRKSLSQSDIFWQTSSCWIKVTCTIKQLYFSSPSIIAKLLISLRLLFSFCACQYKNNEASVLTAFAWFPLNNVKFNLQYQTPCQKLPNSLLRYAPIEDNMTG